jgi:hypothetical protein
MSAERAFNLCWTAVLGIGLLVPFLLVRYGGNAGSFFPVGCRWLQLTGHYCPSCGLTRALQYLYRGDLQASLDLHPAAFWLVGLSLAQLALRIPVDRASHRQWVFLADLAVILATYLGWAGFCFGVPA